MTRQYETERGYYVFTVTERQESMGMKAEGENFKLAGSILGYTNRDLGFHL